MSRAPPAPAPAARRKLVTGDVAVRALALGGTPGQAYAPAMGDG